MTIYTETFIANNAKQIKENNFILFYIQLLYPNMETDLKNFDSYNKNMAKSLIDKMFFWDKVDATFFVDFGCADGALIKFLQNLDPEIHFLGYDNSNDMLNIARKNCNNGKTIFTDKWSDVKTAVNIQRLEGRKTCLILSSVIHEVIHYSGEKEINDFWSNVYNSGFDYVCVRDIIPSRTIDRPADLNDYIKLIQTGNKNKIANFERVWGSLENNKNLIHFLLKHKWDENWDREIKENYFAIYREEFLGLIGKNYELIYHEHFVLPYIRETVKKEFGIIITDNTHLKLILKLKN